MNILQFLRWNLASHFLIVYFGRIVRYVSLCDDTATEKYALQLSPLVWRDKLQLYPFVPFAEMWHEKLDFSERLVSLHNKQVK